MDKFPEITITPATFIKGYIPEKYGSFANYETEIHKKFNLSMDSSDLMYEDDTNIQMCDITNHIRAYKLSDQDINHIIQYFLRREYEFSISNPRYISHEMIKHYSDKLSKATIDKYLSSDSKNVKVDTCVFERIMKMNENEPEIKTSESVQDVENLQTTIKQLETEIATLRSKFEALQSIVKP